jgi:uncharacterized membrane protein
VEEADVTSDNPIVARYLDELREGLTGVSETERSEMVGEIENHIAEAAGAGKNLADVLQTLGPAAELARAYRVELLLNPRTHRWNPLTRWFALVGVAATASLPSLVVVPALAAVGFACTVAGVVVFFAALLSPFLPPGWLGSDFRPGLSLVLGLPVAALGVVSLALLWLYVRFLIRAARAVLADKPVSLKDIGRQ